MTQKLLRSSFVAAVLVLSANFMALTHSGAPPAGHTGAPGDQTCSACHDGPGGSGNVAIVFNNGNNTYEAGKTYSVTVTVTDNSKTRFGFQATALNGANNFVGIFTAGSGVSTQTGVSRSYVGHSSAGTTRSWTFNWQAPGALAGDIALYAAGNAANGNNSTSGDNIYTTSLVLKPSATLGATIAANDQTLCDGQEVTFSATTSGSPTTFSWHFGEGASPATANTAGPHKVTYSSSGTKTVTLGVGDGKRTVSANNFSVQVFAQPVAAFKTLTEKDTFSLGETIIFVNGSSNSTAFVWNFGDGDVQNVTNTNNVNKIFGTPGNKTITLSAANNGCNAVSVTKNVFIRNVAGFDPVLRDNLVQIYIASGSNNLVVRREATVFVERVTLYDTGGKQHLLTRPDITQTEIILPTTTLTTGIYIALVQTQNGIYRQKIYIP